MFPIILTYQQAQMLFAGKLLLLIVSLIAVGFYWWRGRRKAAGGCAVLAVAAALSFLQPVGVPHRTSCVANLKQIDGAVQQWALENKKAATATYSLSDPQVLAYMKGSALPVCPQRGRYSPGTNVGDVPKCSLAASGHAL